MNNTTEERAARNIAYLETLKGLTDHLYNVLEAAEHLDPTDFANELRKVADAIDAQPYRGFEYDERRVDDEGNVSLYLKGEFVGVEW